MMVGKSMDDIGSVLSALGFTWSPYDATGFEGNQRPDVLFVNCGSPTSGATSRRLSIRVAWSIFPTMRRTIMNQLFRTSVNPVIFPLLETEEPTTPRSLTNILQPSSMLIR